MEDFGELKGGAEDGRINLGSNPFGRGLWYFVVSSALVFHLGHYSYTLSMFNDPKVEWYMPREQWLRGRAMFRRDHRFDIENEFFAKNGVWRYEEEKKLWETLNR